MPDSLSRSPAEKPAPAKIAAVDHVRDVIRYAHLQGASDLHFEPGRGSFQIRMRRDCLLESIYVGTHADTVRLATQVKVMADLDVAEHRMPQDGRISFPLAADHSLNIRVSTCPTAYGERVALRLLDPRAQIRSLGELGLEDSQRELLQRVIARPNGLVLVAGPAGSGKTTTLYSLLSALSSTTRNIATIEDPVEIALPGINQVPVNPRLSLTFARALRSLMRQDPDVLMIGEIRDRETAEIAVQAAQTGHLVFSTLHSSSALESINRLAHMGIPRYELLTALQMVVAQRLLRLNAGGRTGVYECLAITPAAKEYALTHDFLDYAALQKRSSLLTLQAAAQRKVKAGLVSLAEVQRVVPE